MKQAKTLFICIFIALIATKADVWGQKSFDIDDSMSMQEFKEQALTKKDEIWVVDFWASWCRPCMAIIPEIKEIHKNLEGEKVKFISISWDNNKGAWKNGITRSGMPWTQILVPNVRNAPFLTENFKHKYIPSMFIVTGKGKVKKVDETTLERKVRKEIKKL